ncbi:BamA/TamA family outer membrane protein [Botryobacter ruber]|uniref:BamA/TamA family outer membrane protein n=1 Tax=Botryobacter ruber TaxID=2171629 RepID=UPI000E0BB11F|nr:BamA/TamA family outer membrane protein [Botryobacter ruber]
MKLLCLLLLLSCYSQATAQNPDSTNARQRRVLLLPTVGHAPETRWYIGAFSLFTLRHHSGTHTRPSQFIAAANFTQNRQLVLSTEWNVFAKEGNYYSTGELVYLKFPENFYGIGPDAPAGHVEQYDSKRIEFNVTLLRRIKRHLYVGPRYQLQYMFALEPAPGGILDRKLVPGATGGLSSGVGAAAVFDNRQHILNPQQGTYAAASATAFGRATGSDFGFIRYQLDLRHYFRLPWQQHLLALQAYGVFSSGSPPFRMLGLLGSSSIMRGYYPGRYRERQYLALQAEYRLPLFRRFGAAAFAGAGDVAYQLRQFQLTEFKPSYGLGLRFKINRQENLNLRLDYARGHNTSAFYLTLGEAF